MKASIQRYLGVMTFSLFNKVDSLDEDANRYCELKFFQKNDGYSMSLAFIALTQVMGKIGGG